MGVPSPKYAAEFMRYVDRYGARGLARGHPPRDFWAVLQETGADFAMGSDFWVVFRGCYAAPASPTWGNVGAVRRFGLIRPAKPPRSHE